MTNRLAIYLALAALIASAAAKADGQHQIIRTYSAQGNGGQNLTSGVDYLVQSTGVSCPKTFASCTIQMQAMDQLCGGSYGQAFNTYVAVDGQIPTGIVGFTINVPCSGGTWLGNASVGPGKHVLSFYSRWQDQGNQATQGAWAVAYTVTVP
jgi:hypothetical protein